MYQKLNVNKLLHVCVKHFNETKFPKIQYKVHEVKEGRPFDKLVNKIYNDMI